MIRAILACFVLALAACASTGHLEEAAAAADRGDYSVAIGLSLTQATAGEPIAQVALGNYLLAREPRNAAEAVMWFQRAALQGYAQAQFLIGLSYESGEVLPQDYAEAIRWHLLAATQGNVHAQLRLGEIYELGSDVAQDNAEALKWFRLAAAQGSEYAQARVSALSGVNPGRRRLP